ncbi:Gibberellin 2-beta-dioxygenase 8 [Platanthera zijinensis]|uniref:Gibberellin 2-beta-dioxygenase 8 n=1 Tax=Platanthera zijinensis TaxID=2320716 RepID=A0AAP0BQV4_9ASPA
MRKVASAMSKLAGILSAVLAENLGCPRHLFGENCSEITCFLRLNQYPHALFRRTLWAWCPTRTAISLRFSTKIASRGLQFMKDSKWVSIKPNPKAFIINNGDLFQAQSSCPLFFPLFVYYFVANNSMSGPWN